MADIGAQETPKKGGKKTLKKKVVRIDMTPMVDLMCLLITFFMLTTAFSKPKIMEIVLPEKIKSEKEKAEAPKIAKSRTLNIILGPDNKVLWYTGAVDDPKNPPPLQITDFGPNGIRQLLLERNRALFRKIDQFQKDVIAGKINIKRDSLEAAIRQLKNEDDTGPIVLIKAYKKSTYGNFVDILDEMSIVGIARYTIVDIAPIEEQMVEKALGITPEPATNN
ncbi:MAG TPA: biopolymer transporter ExbD [Bacteroidales bacterium]|nr:biopolymer transporter ExbD [Bacteroidales bacterium]HQG36064.1 biopolymer transporter ExbD [Bacteroidales bacterium]HQG52826.1 biopolymer transporter ExbD [Bacteroidales bacterium]HQJ20843.1 biopolymer transporter ExbD [Bacteroidales bacterium]